MINKFYYWVVLTLFLLISCTSMVTAGEIKSRSVLEPLNKKTFPLLFGMNIGRPKPYHNPVYQQQLAKLDAVILGFGPDWNSPNNPEKLRKVVLDLKKLNPELLVGQYTILTESYDRNSLSPTGRDKTEIIYKHQWWLRDEDGDRVRRSKDFDMWDVNITRWTKSDEKGRRYPEWLAERDYQMFFKPIPELDIWYFDSIFHRPPRASADLNGDGEDDNRNDPGIKAAFREGHKSEWGHARQLKSNMLFLGNFTTSNLSQPEFKGQLNGAFLEALMGLRWSIESRKGWHVMMARYRAAIENTLSPHLVVFHVFGESDDYRFFRYAYTSSLLDNGYFSFSDEEEGYSTVPWFDEYDFELGMPIEPAIKQPWNDGVFRRRFENGVVFINPTSYSKKIELESGYSRIEGVQDTQVNNGKSVVMLTLPAKDGIVLVKDGH